MRKMRETKGGKKMKGRNEKEEIGKEEMKESR